MRSPASASLAIQVISPSRRVLIDGRSEGSGKALESIVIGIDFEETTCRVGTLIGEAKSRPVVRLQDKKGMRSKIRFKIYKHIRLWRQYANKGHQIGHSDSFCLVLAINLRIWWLWCTGGRGFIAIVLSPGCRYGSYAGWDTCAIVVTNG